MDWIGIAISGSVILAFVNIIDSHILSGRIKNFRVYLSVLGTIYLIAGALIYVTFPLPASSNPWLLAGAVGNSIVRMAAIMIMLYSLRTQAVSSVVSIVYAYPVLVTILATPLLGEILTWSRWLAVILVVGGVILVSLEKGRSGKTALSRVLLLVLTIPLFTAGDLSSKYLLEYFTFWKLLSINALVMGLIFALISFRPSTFRSLWTMEMRNSTLSLTLANELVAIGGMLLGTRAISMGPISVVSAILGSRPLFVSLFALAAGYLWPRFLRTGQNRERWSIVLIATILIVAGIGLVYL